MKLSLLKKMKLFHVNFRREHGIIYGYVYYVFMIMSVFFIIIGSNYFSGGYAFSTPEDAWEMFSCGISYAIVVDVVIPMICGLKNWRKYLLPGTYQSTTNRIAKKILQTEEFTCPIPVADKRKGKHSFLESANYFSFYGQLIPKNEIKEFEFDYSLYRDHRSYRIYNGYRSYRRYKVFFYLLSLKKFWIVVIISVSLKLSGFSLYMLRALCHISLACSRRLVLR